jgi:hypothetical protein
MSDKPGDLQTRFSGTIRDRDDSGQTDSVSEKSFLACMNRNMWPEILLSATTYRVQNSIFDTLRNNPHLLRSGRAIKWWLLRSVSEKSLFQRTDRNMQPEIRRSATTYSVQNSISDTLFVCPETLRQEISISDY